MRYFILLFLLIILAQSAYAIHVDPVRGHLTHTQTIIPPQSEKPLSLDLEIYYSRFNRKNGPMGQNWTHSYDIFLHPNSDGAKVFIGGFQKRHFFFPDNKGGYESPQMDFSQLKENADGSWLVILNNGMKYTFNKEYYLEKIEDHLGNKITIDRSIKNQAILTDSGGRVLIIKYENERLSQFIYNDVVYEFLYYKDGMLNICRQNNKSKAGPQFSDEWHYGYDPVSKHLAGLRDPQNEFYKFAHTDDRVTRMVMAPGVIDLEGNETPDSYLYSYEWIYAPDPKNRLIGSTTLVIGKTGEQRVLRYNFTRERFTAQETPPGKKVVRKYYETDDKNDPRNGNLKEMIYPSIEGVERVVRFNSYDKSGNATEVITLTRKPGSKKELIKEHKRYEHNDLNKIISITNVLTNVTKKFPNGLP